MSEAFKMTKLLGKNFLFFTDILYGMSYFFKNFRRILIWV